MPEIANYQTGQNQGQEFYYPTPIFKTCILKHKGNQSYNSTIDSDIGISDSLATVRKPCCIFDEELVLFEPVELGFKFNISNYLLRFPIWGLWVHMYSLLFHSLPPTSCLVISLPIDVSHYIKPETRQIVNISSALFLRTTVPGDILLPLAESTHNDSTTRNSES